MASSLLVFASACGGVAPQGLPPGDAPPPGSQPTPQPSPKPSPKPSPPSADLTGSYDLAFTSAISDHPAPFPSASPASLGGTARLDVRASAVGYDAVITPRWGDPIHYDVSDDGTAITLSAHASRDAYPAAATFGSRPAPEVYVTDSYRTFAITRGADGALATFTASGDESAVYTDEGWPSKLTARGTVAKDVTMPAWRVGTASPEGPSNALLPWDAIDLRLAEPIDAAAVHVQVQGGVPITFATLPTSDTSAAWSGVVALRGALSPWDGVADAQISASLVDHAGNGAPDVGGATVRFLTVPPAQTKHVFTSGTPSVGAWGDVSFLPAGDAHCEAGSGCARIVTTNACGAARAGIAARLAVDAGKRVTVRYRVLAKMQLAASSMPPSSALFGISTSQGQSADARPDGLTATTEDGMMYASGWTSLPVDTTAASDVGVAIHSSVALCAQHPLVPYDVEIFVSWIGAE